MKIFVSYASEDRKAAREMAKHLRGAGHDVYPTAQWPQDIGAALKRAEAYVILLTPAAVSSPFVNEEMKLALTSERFADRVIPVILEPTAAVPWILQTMSPIRAAKPESVADAVNERLEERPDGAR